MQRTLLRHESRSGKEPFPLNEQECAILLLNLAYDEFGDKIVRGLGANLLPFTPVFRHHWCFILITKLIDTTTTEELYHIELLEMDLLVPTHKPLMSTHKLITEFLSDME